MKKRVLSTVLLALSLGLASCGNNFTQKYADKINSAAATENEKDDLTFDQVQKALGKDYSGVLLSGTGIATWTKTKGNTTYSMVVTFAKNKATGCVYSETTKDEEKK